MRTFLKSFLAAAAITAAATSAQASTRIFQYLENDPGTIQLVNGPSGYTLSTVGTPTVFATLTNPNTGERARGDAIFNFTATGSGFATDLGGGRFVQSLTGGSLSFTAAEDFVIGSRTFAAGSNLLSLDFLGGFIEVNVNGTTGASEVTIPGDSFSNVQFALFSFPPAEFLGFTIGLSGTQFAVGNLAHGQLGRHLQCRRAGTRHLGDDAGRLRPGGPGPPSQQPPGHRRGLIRTVNPDANRRPVRQRTGLFALPAQAGRLICRMSNISTTR